MATNQEKLRRLLSELFQLDQADLDFGIYRIMNQKRSEILRFLDTDLLPQVREELAGYRSGDQAMAEHELEQRVKGLEALGLDIEEDDTVKELRARVAAGVDSVALEREVFSSLYNFFRRYYHQGDFLSLRRYKEGVYAIPYEGEEVKLHWANADQYYVKSAENFRDYTFRLGQPPEDEQSDTRPRVHFKLVEADTEQNNNKAAEGKERRFILDETEPVQEVDGELLIRFEYRPDAQNRKQAALNELATQRILEAGHIDSSWIRALSTLVPTEKNKERTLLDKYVSDYTARNTFDYFIHKDLGKFLRRELDFFIKNEVMHLDDIEEADAPRAEQYLSKIKVIRRIAHKIIAFLEQLENFQKKLWLKKKFVVETNYCVTLDRVPKVLYSAIAKNKAQIEEWKQLFAIDEIQADLKTPAFKTPLTTKFLEANPFLVLDTKYFDDAFKSTLLASFDDLDEAIDGVIIHSENFQALNLLQERYREEVKCIYIDPPYNKGGDGFAYKDNYQHSSWLSMMQSRLVTSRYLLSNEGAIFVSVDNHEYQNALQLISPVFGASQLIPAITNLKGNYDADGFVDTHEYVVAGTVGSLATLKELAIDEDKIESEWSEDAFGLFKLGDGLRRTGADAPREKRPKGWFPIFISVQDQKVYITENDQPKSSDDFVLWPINNNGNELSWSWSKSKISNESHNLLLRGDAGDFSIYKKQRASIGDIPSRKPRSFLYKPEYSSTNGGNIMKRIMGERLTQYTPKSVHLLEDLVLLGANSDSLILDYFAGSGTTGHAVINLNREDGGRRKYLLVEMGEYFDTVLKPRLQKVIYSKDWKGGKPVSREGSSHLFKYIRLESYEDTLNNLELERTSQQSTLLEEHRALREEYSLRYMLDVESRGSASLLNIEAFSDPFNYTLNIASGGAGETRPTTVDLIETFNYLLGLRVQLMDTIREFRVVQGRLASGEKVLCIWRNTEKTSNADLDTFFQKQGYNTRDSEFDFIYVNGDNNLENLRADDETWKVRLIEEEFQRLMFDVQDV